MSKELIFAYKERYGRAGSLSFLIRGTSEQMDSILGSCLPWHDELGKHTEGEYTFSAETVKLVDVEASAVAPLLDTKAVDFYEAKDLLNEIKEYWGESCG